MVRGTLIFLSSIRDAFCSRDNKIVKENGKTGAFFLGGEEGALGSDWKFFCCQCIPFRECWVGARKDAGYDGGLIRILEEKKA